MWTPLIGEHAGKVWDILKENGPVGLNALKKQAKLDDKWLYLCLGWLAREDKIAVAQVKNLITISLK